MEKPIINGGKSPIETCSFFNKVFFGYPWSLIKRGASEELNHDSMYTPVTHDHTFPLWERFHKGWRKESRKQNQGGKPSFWLTLGRAYGVYYGLVGILIFIEDACRLISPMLLQWLLEYFDTDTSTTQEEAYLYAGGIALSAILQSIVSPNIVFYLIRSGMQWQTGTCAAIYRKTLKLSNGSASATSTGHIVDIATTDAEKLDWNIWFLHFWRGFLQAGFALTYTYYQIGPVVFTALGYVAVMLVIQSVIGKIIAHYREETYQQMDKRVDLIGEIITGMRVIKMYCWEKPFGDVIAAIRKKEIRYLWRTYNWVAIMAELYTFNQRCLTATIVLVYVYINGDISASKVFPMFAYFGVMSIGTLDLWPWGIKTWLETSVSAKRIQNFLLLEERGESEHSDKYIHKKEGTGAVLATNVKASWSLDDPQITLNKISFSVNKGEILTIAGEVGSGKSSLLMAICGELPVSDGSIFCGGRIAYTAQQPWVFSASIRQNILFGQDYDEDRYKEVLSACSLNQDLALFSHRDQTLVGDKGVTLSGGQKARVSLARAVYADADVYLLDDPLSAVDTHVGRELFTQCIQNILKDKVVILVTHQLQYLQHSDKILIMHKGESKAYGTYTEIIESGLDLTKLLPVEKNDKDDTDENQNVVKTTQKNSEINEEEREEEDRAVGSVDWSVYWQYFRAGGNVCVLFFILVINILTQVMYNGGDWWLSVWSDAENKKNATIFNNTHLYHCEKVMPWDCLSTLTSGYIYIAFLVGMFLFGLVRAWSLYTVGVRSGRKLHQQLYTAVVRAPIRFHDTNPKGRIVNRFSNDISAVDNTVPDMMEDFLQNAFNVVGMVVLITILNPVVSVIILPLLIVLYFVRRYYLQAQRQIERIMSAAHSPVLTHLTGTLDGIHTIRAFDKQDELINQFDSHYNAMMGTWMTELSVFSWFFMIVSLTAGIFNAFTTFACLLVQDYGIFTLATGDIGLILSYVTGLMWQVQNTIRLSSDVELQMIRTERVLRYTKIKSEAELKSEKPPPPQWPQNGKIVFDHVSFAYSEDSPLVLKNVFCEIKGSEKIGIAGRTGAGKSSLMQCLFRMAEPIGQIRIDDVPINDLGLHEVREAISVIPQDPFLFSGSVRENLDPFNNYSDDAIWSSLEQVQLKQVILQNESGLHAMVNEGGSNFSVGQKQLFCLARAILKKSKILLLDEATANVDKKTDELIQSTIREKFYDCTVLTVAHRLHTIMDCDRVMVFEAGELVEFDEPFTLLQNNQGYLFQLTLQTGLSEHKRLLDIAEQAYIKSKSITGT